MHRSIIVRVADRLDNMKLRDINIMNEGVYDPGIFKAIFLAGGPGSGKSFVGHELLGIPKGGFSGINMSVAPSGVKLINSDPEFEYFLKKVGIDPKDLASLSDEEFKKATEGDESPRGKAQKLKDTKQMLYTKGRLGLLIDGTGDNYAKIKKKNTELKNMGYDTYMLFINTTLEVAQERNVQRDRQLPEKLVKKIWTDVQKNMGKFQTLFGSNFRIIDNSKTRSAQRDPGAGVVIFPKMLYTTINKFIKSPVKSGLAKRWIKRQLELKKKTGM